MNKIRKLIRESTTSISKRRHENEPSSCTVLVRLLELDETVNTLQIVVQKDCHGQWLFDEICEKLGGVLEKDYFSLRYMDKYKQKQWMDLSRNVVHQLRDSHSKSVSFRVKHYPSLPLSDLQQNLTRYLLYLQLRRDLYQGRLMGKSSDLYRLAAHVLQAELGEFCSGCETEAHRFLSETKVLKSLTHKTERKIIEMYKTLGNLSTMECETLFIKYASEMDTYGIEPFYVRDQKGNNLYLALTHLGVATFQGSRRAHTFKWSDIHKVYPNGRLFVMVVHLDDTVDNDIVRRKHTLGFKCESSAAAKALWLWTVDRKYFFTLNRSSEARKVKSRPGLFKSPLTFRYSGRCQKEVLLNSAVLSNMPQPLVRRRHESLRRHPKFHRQIYDRSATLPHRPNLYIDGGDIIDGHLSAINLENLYMLQAPHGLLSVPDNVELSGSRDGLLCRSRGAASGIESSQNCSLDQLSRDDISDVASSQLSSTQMSKQPGSRQKRSEDNSAEDATPTQSSSALARVNTANQPISHSQEKTSDTSSTPPKSTSSEKLKQNPVFYVNGSVDKASEIPPAFIKTSKHKRYCRQCAYFIVLMLIVISVLLSAIFGGIFILIYWGEEEQGWIRHRQRLSMDLPQRMKVAGSRVLDHMVDGAVKPILNYLDKW